MPIDAGRNARQELFIPYNAGLGIIGAAGVSTTVTDGAAVEKEIGTTGIVGLLLDTAADMANIVVPIPALVNWSCPVGVRVAYATGSSTAADTIDWIVLYDIIAAGSALAEGATALDTAITQDTVSGVANALEYSPRGVIAAGKITTAHVEGSAFISFNIELDAFAAGLTEDKFFLGLLLDYQPKRHLGNPPRYTWSAPYNDQSL